MTWRERVWEPGDGPVLPDVHDDHYPPGAVPLGDRVRFTAPDGHTATAMAVLEEGVEGQDDPRRTVVPGVKSFTVALAVPPEGGTALATATVVLDLLALDVAVDVQQVDWRGLEHVPTAALEQELERRAGQVP